MPQVFAERTRARPRPQLETFTDFPAPTVDLQPSLQISASAADVVSDLDTEIRDATNIVEQSKAVIGLGDLSISANTPESDDLAGAVTSTQESRTSLPDELRREEYNRSLRRMRELGKVAIAGETGEHARESARRDWLTSLAEMLENAPEFRGVFEINDVYSYPVTDDGIMFLTADGATPMERMIRDGAWTSHEAAKTDPRMQTQANRDQADVHNIVRLNEMVHEPQAPNTRLGISRSIGKAMKDDPKFWKEKGYREGLAFIQAYYIDRKQGTVSAATLSIDGVRDDIFDAVLAEHGVYMNSGDNDNGMRHGVERTSASQEEALAWAKAVRARCYELQKDNRKRMSVNDFMQQRSEYLDAAFDSLGVPIAKAIASGVKNEQVQQFAAGLLQNTQHLDKDLVTKLAQLSRAERFTDSDGRMLLGLSLYAVVEKLHNDATRSLRSPSAFMESSQLASTMAPSGVPPAAYMVQQLVGSVHGGARAGRSHGGSCAGVTNVSGKGVDDDPTNLQAAFSGLAAGGEGSQEKPDDDGSSLKPDKHGKRTFKCPRPKCGRINVRRKKDVLLEKCQHCDREIPRC